MHKRKRKLINKPLQLKLVGIFTAIGATCALFQVILINTSLLQLAQSIPNGGEQLLEQSRWLVLKNTMWTLGVLLPLMVCVGIAATHRVAGPAYRMTQHLKEIAAGGPVRACKIRKHDEFSELCDALNAALEQLAPAADAGEGFDEDWTREAPVEEVAAEEVADGSEDDREERAA